MSEQEDSQEDILARLCDRQSAKIKELENYLAVERRVKKRMMDKFDHLNRAVYEAMVYSVISAPTSEKLKAAQSWEPNPSGGKP
jgi:acyl-ACP thioesterase